MRIWTHFEDTAKGPERSRRERSRSEDRGVSLIETMIAVVIALVGVFSLGQVVFLSMVQDKNQGSEVTRATIYAQDKMEKLLSLDFASCTLAASSQPATCNTTNIGASGWTQGLLQGGQTGPPLVASCPTTGASIGYIDFLDANGIQVPGATPATSCSAMASNPVAYIRMWQVTDMASTGGPAIKKVAVSVYAQSAVSAPGGKPIVQVTSYLSNPN